MPATRRLTRPRTALSVVAALLALSALVSVRRASAYVPDQRYITAISATLNSTGVARDAAEGRVRIDHYGPDGLAGYDGTPDGRGAFVFYRRFGYRNPPLTVPAVGYLDNAVYAFMVTPAASRAIAQATGESVPVGSVRAATVTNFDFILNAWGRDGWEQGHGYPIAPQRYVTDVDKRVGCKEGDRVQYFHRLAGPEQTQVLCITSSGRSVVWRNV
jgi:hypothetical protein